MSTTAEPFRAALRLQGQPFVGPWVSKRHGVSRAMFEFGKDLKKLFDRARESEDLAWVELIPAELVAAEARREATDAGRVSCAAPVATGLRAAWLWREAARRMGSAEALERAERCAADALKIAVDADARTLAAVAIAEARMAGYDLFGDPARLNAAYDDLRELRPQRAPARAQLAAAAGRLAARRARLTGEPGHIDAALRALDSALLDAARLAPTTADDLRLEREALAVEAGIERRDGALLDQAGLGLRDLVQASAPEQRPLTRARALALAGAGLAALGRLAGDGPAEASGRALFEAAADQFTPDHSPLDWVAIQLSRPRADTALSPLAQCEALTRAPGLVLGALSSERRLAAEAALAEAMGDAEGLDRLAKELRARLRGAPEPLAWAAAQIGLARLALALSRLRGDAPGPVGLMLAEAAQTAREMGALALEARAQALASAPARAV